MTGTILEKIVDTKREEVAAARQSRPLDAVRDAAAMADPPRDFYSAVASSSEGVRLIAEIKRASPSAGLIRSDFEPAAIARAYAQGGASALSVLTDRPYFQGDLSYIAAVKAVVALPVLRKDFMVDDYQVYESRAAGADAILLIAAVLPAEKIDAWSRLAFDLGMASLIEVHDEQELQAVRACATADRRSILGINNRDLHAQRTNLDTTRRLAEALEAGTSFVAESGIKTRDDVLTIQGWGATAILVGETLMSAEDPGEKVRELLGGVKRGP